MVSAAVEEFYRLGSCRSRVYSISLFRQILLERIRHHRFVVYYQNACLFYFHLFLTPVDNCSLVGLNFSANLQFDEGL